MEPALWVSKSGLEAQDKNIATIANNLANVNTTAFKKGRALFEDLIYQNLRQAGAQSSQNSQIPTGINMGTGVHLVATEKIFSQGSLQNTENALDVAIEGRGFFTVLMPDGTQAYTRDGSFKTDSTGQIVNSNGYPLQPNITIPPQTTKITIGTDGTVSALVAGNNAPSVIGNIQLTDFINPAGLQPIGQNLYTETVASGTPITDNPGNSGLGTLLQGSLEASNVNVVEELVNMIQAQRSYEITAKSIQTVDSMLQYLTQTL
ncbi:flagellar basal-body rod protein FlgG [Legionella pneumophila]|uniref:Flagellar basal-body rod protein FlgG n=1 Tax=Legionella pneumophila subsp. pascullei TaxID=91890 RepID=A0AAX2IWA4_LEGPN|nr:flagellar basal-body rod protein FlgG [Legionella pneumophila]AMP90070.1 flagellar basal-body rod protein FlgG [Legionella pneumophila subsp. pascullei]AMP92263.1 flagellar basal-body rod protein FlgG [Legionella pneumophila subsp. pascullei]AMP95228.1 flagellar basal-body rod protein FlgG [Legionella pneumophila subsp. pascullei]SQG90120.1 flagellar basal-body rod protein FlgG [Legionella pneumophila subsp. pascullei]VEH06074.1 flagellar basal-body rod protein FlgG [Legionella pneumophila 